APHSPHSRRVGVASPGLLDLCALRGVERASKTRLLNGLSSTMNKRTLYDKIWDDHLVTNNEDGTSLIYIDRHLVHEVTSPQAFEGLRLSGRKVRAPERTLAV